MLTGAGLEVMQHVQNGEIIEPQPLQHVIFLTGLYADAPARQKWALMLAVAAYLGCGYCLFQGIRLGSSMSFCGYVDKVPQEIIFGGLRMKATDERLQLSHK